MPDGKCYEICGASENCTGANLSPCCVDCFDADVDVDDEIGIFDIRKAARAYGSAEVDDPETPEDETLHWDSLVDFRKPYGEIDIMDIRAIAKMYGMDCETGVQLGFTYYPIVIIVVLVILVSIFGFFKFFAKKI